MLPDCSSRSPLRIFRWKTPAKCLFLQHSSWLAPFTSWHPHYLHLTSKGRQRCHPDATHFAQVQRMTQWGGPTDSQASLLLQSPKKTLRSHCIHYRAIWASHTSWHRSRILYLGRKEEQHVLEGDSRIIYSTRIKDGTQRHGRFRAVRFCIAPMGRLIQVT